MTKGRSRSGVSKPASTSSPLAHGVSAESAAVLRVVLEDFPVGVTVFDAELRMIACNARFKELLAFPDEIFAAGLPNMADLARFNARRGEYGPGDPEDLARQVVRRAQAMEPHRYERTRPDGTVLEIVGRPIEGGGFITTYADVTERHQTEQALRQNEAQLRLIFDTSSVAIFFVDQQGVITHANRRMAEMFACPMDRLIGSEYVAHIAESERDVGRAKMLALLASTIPSVDLERHYWRDDGGCFWGRLTGQRMVAEDGRSVGLVGVILDVTQRRAAEEELAERSRELERINQALAASNAELIAARETMERMAMHDQLTGLANRHKFLQTYSIEIERRNRTGNPLSLLLVDVDHFKQINDRLGHLAGDSCLRALAAVLERNVRAADLVGRFGGEEFVVLLPDTDAAGALGAAENLRHAVAEADFKVGVEILRLTISIGAATLLPGQPGDFDRLMNLADRAVYQAKDGGRNLVMMGAEDAAVAVAPGRKTID